MNIQFENMRGRTISGGFDNRPSAYRAVTPRDSLPLFVPQSILPDAALPFRQLSKPVPHVFELFKTTLMVLGTSAVFLIAVFIALFVHIPSPL